MNDVVGELLLRLWPGQDAHVEPLVGGITNANFIVRLSGEQVVLRIAGANSALLGIDRRVELEAGRLASSIGIAPDVLAGSETEGWIVTRFLTGRPIPLSELATEPMVSDVATTLRRLHGVGTLHATFNPFTTIRHYHDIAAASDVVEPLDYPRALAMVDAIADVRPFRSTAFCHNDLLGSNFLHDGELRLLDWEYAAMGDPFFDLANFSANQQLSPAMDESLLTHYWGQCDAPSLAILSLMKVVSELRETMWGVVQRAISALDVDFDAYAQERSERYSMLTTSMDVDETLRLAATYVDPAQPSDDRLP